MLLGYGYEVYIIFFLWKKEYNSSFSCRTMKLWEQSYSKNKQRTTVKSLVAQLAPLGLSNGEVQGSSPPSSIVSIGLSKTQITNHRSNTQQSSVQNRLLDPFQSEKPIPNIEAMDLHLLILRPDFANMQVHVNFK